MLPERRPERLLSILGVEDASLSPGQTASRFPALFPPRLDPTRPRLALPSPASLGHARPRPTFPSSALPLVGYPGFGSTSLEYCPGLSATARRHRSSGQQPGTKSRRGPADRPLVHRSSAGRCVPLNWFTRALIRLFFWRDVQILFHSGGRKRNIVP